MRPALALALFVFAAGACTLFDPYDAVEPPPDASTSNGDASATDATGIDDARNDPTTPPVPIDGDATCGATFCDDFDTTALGATWTDKVLDKATMLLVDAGRSSPFALEVTTPSGAFEGRTGFLYKRFSPVKGASCSFALKPIERAGQPYVFYFHGTAPEVKDWTTWIALMPSETRLGVGASYADGGGSPYIAASGPVVPSNQWTVLEVSTDLSKARLEIDGIQVAELALPVPVSTSLVDVYIGIEAFETTPQVVQFDDVRCTITN